MPKNLGFYQARVYTKGRGRWAGLQDIIVFHYTDGAAGLKELEANPTRNVKLFTGSFGWLCHPTTTATTSCHFLVDRGGRYIQLVNFADQAICNGNNAEMRNLKGVKSIIKSRVDSANMYTYSIELEAYAAIGDPPGTPECLQGAIEAMYLCIDDMYKNKVQTFRPNGDHLMGHCHISPVNRPNCPAANMAEKFPWAEIFEAAEVYCEATYPGWIPSDKPATPSTEMSGTDSGVGIGDTVSIITGATWYGSTSKINSVYIDGKTYPVDDLNGNRVVLEKKGICSPIDVKFLKVVKKATPTVVDTDGNPNFNEKDKVRINAGATWFESTKAVPGWAIGPEYSIDELKGNRAVVDKKGLNSPIDTKFLTKVSK